MSISKFISIFFTLAFSILCFAIEPEIDAAKALFTKYIALEHSFDPAVADLYADTALIKNKRTYPTGQTRELVMPAPAYKSLIRESMSMAKVRGDYSEYSDIKYSPEQGKVRIIATRFSKLKNYNSPISLLVGQSENGSWIIYEELSESKP